MALNDKDILITPNKGQSSEPKIVFSGASSTLGPQNITLQVYPTSNGTLSFEGSAGQLFSITNDLSGIIFSVNDVSGIPSIEVLDTGVIKLAQYSGNVGIGLGNPNHKLDVNGSINFTGNLLQNGNPLASGEFSRCGNNNIRSSQAGTGGTGTHNFFAGFEAGMCNTTGSHNNFIGHCAGRCNTTGCNNNFIGRYAGRYNTTGSCNNFFGECAGFSNTTGSHNIFFGRSAGANNISGWDNIFIGLCAGANNIRGLRNTIIGCGAGVFNDTGCFNTFFGNAAGRCNTCGSNNTFIGNLVGFRNTTGCYNIFFGCGTGYNNTTGCNNLLFGHNAGVTGVTPSGLCNITTECNRIIMGNSSHNCAQIATPWVTVSDCRDKCIFGNVPHGRDFLGKINPIEYAFKDRETNEITDPEGKRRYGFSAQEVLDEEGDHPVVVSNEDPDRLQMTNDYMIPILVNAIKELSDEAKELKEKITVTSNDLENLKISFDHTIPTLVNTVSELSDKIDDLKLRLLALEER